MVAKPAMTWSRNRLYAYATPWNPWTPVEAMDTELGRRFERQGSARDEASCER